jgi:hypothetical protein
MISNNVVLVAPVCQVNECVGYGQAALAVDLPQQKL